MQAVYWALGMLAGLVSGSRPETEVEGVASIGIFSVGILFFAYAIGVLSSIDEQGSEQAREFQAKMAYCLLYTSPSPRDRG